MCKINTNIEDNYDLMVYSAILKSGKSFTIKEVKNIIEEDNKIKIKNSFLNVIIYEVIETLLSCNLIRKNLNKFYMLH